jgi:hypothetical protein
MDPKRLARAIWRQYRVAVVLIALATCALTFALFSVGGSEEPAPRAEGRQILNRIWFDRYPESVRDDLSVWIFLGGGIGVYQTGSAFRAGFDVFDFERRGQTLDMRFLHDSARAELEFTIEKCDELPPFDLCLSLPNAPRGQSRYYSFDFGEEMESSIPWSRRLMAQARAHAIQ